MSKAVTIEESITIDESAEKLWEVCADEFEHIDKWDSNVKSSSARGEPIGASKTGGRVCHQYNGRKTVEDLVKFDAFRQRFTYAITEGLPGFVVSAENTWRLHELETNKTQLTMRLEMRVKGLMGTLMKKPMKSQMGKVLRNAQEELKHYVEHSQHHPRKQKKERGN